MSDLYKTVLFAVSYCPLEKISDITMFLADSNQCILTIAYFFIRVQMFPNSGSNITAVHT